MKKKIAVIFVLVTLVALSGCSLDTDRSIEKVKKYWPPGENGTMEQQVALLAGAIGEAEWRAFNSELGEHTVRVVQVTIKKGHRVAEFQYLYNPQTEGVQLRSASFDGKQSSLLELAVNILQFMYYDPSKEK